VKLRFGGNEVFRHMEKGERTAPLARRLTVHNPQALKRTTPEKDKKWGRRAEANEGA